MIPYDRMSIDDFRMEYKKGRMVFENILLIGDTLNSARDMNLNGFYFKRCYFRDVYFSSISFKGAIFENTGMENVNIDHSNGDLSKFIDCGMHKALILSSSLINSNFSRLNLKQKENMPLRFFDCKLKGTSFYEANLKETKFESSNLEEAVFKNAIMMHTKLDRTQIQSADFTDAKNLTMTMLEKVNIAPIKNNRFIAGIKFENALKLFNLLFTDQELEGLKANNSHFYGTPLDTREFLGYWALEAVKRHLDKVNEIYRLPSDQIPTERELMLDVLKNDLRVKGIEKLFL